VAFSNCVLAEAAPAVRCRQRRGIRAQGPAEPVAHSRAPHGGHVSNRGKKFFFLPQKWGMILVNEVAQA
jgi:hypothetical protein